MGTGNSSRDELAHLILNVVSNDLHNSPLLALNLGRVLVCEANSLIRVKCLGEITGAIEFGTPTAGGSSCSSCYPSIVMTGSLSGILTSPYLLSFHNFLANLADILVFVCVTSLRNITS